MASPFDKDINNQFQNYNKSYQNPYNNFLPRPHFSGQNNQDNERNRKDFESLLFPGTDVEQDPFSGDSVSFDDDIYFPPPVPINPSRNQGVFGHYWPPPFPNFHPYNNSQSFAQPPYHLMYGIMPTDYDSSLEEPYGVRGHQAWSNNFVFPEQEENQNFISQLLEENEPDNEIQTKIETPENIVKTTPVPPEQNNWPIVNEKPTPKKVKKQIENEPEIVVKKNKEKKQVTQSQNKVVVESPPAIKTWAEIAKKNGGDDQPAPQTNPTKVQNQPQAKIVENKTSNQQITPTKPQNQQQVKNMDNTKTSNQEQQKSQTNRQQNATNQKSNQTRQQPINSFKQGQQNVESQPQINTGENNIQSNNKQQTQIQRVIPNRLKNKGNTPVSATKIDPSLSFLKDINPTNFNINPEIAKFFVIKSYSEDDIHKSIKYMIWTSTDNGNKKLDKAWKDINGKGPIYLFFSVNASGQFCGVAQMTSPLDYSKKSEHWQQDKWNGQFTVKWIFIKDIPNGIFKNIKLTNNENKPVTNSRDTQEVLLEPGRELLKIFRDFKLKTSILDDFEGYNKSEEEKKKKTQLIQKKQ